MEVLWYPLSHADKAMRGYLQAQGILLILLSALLLTQIQFVFGFKLGL